MIANPLVSISCITYNHAPYIRACLDGFLMQQTNFAFEVVIHDDASTDGTKEIIEEYTAKYPSVFFPVYQYKNQYSQGVRGMMARFNFPRCRGKYIALCEGDDYWTDPLKLQKQVDFLEVNPDYTICFHKANLLKVNMQLELHPIPKISSSGEYFYKDLLNYYNFITTASVLFRKPSFFKFPVWFKSLPFGDLGLYMILSRNGRIKCLEDVMSVYRIHSGGLYSKLSHKNRLIQYIDFYKKICPYLSKEEQVIVVKQQQKKISQLANVKFPKSKFKRTLFQFMYFLK